MKDTLNVDYLYVERFIRGMNPLDKMPKHIAKLQDELMNRNGGYGEELTTVMFIQDACVDITSGKRTKEQVLEQLNKSTGHYEKASKRFGNTNYRTRSI